MTNSPHYRILLAVPDGFADKAVLSEALLFLKTQDIKQTNDALFVHDGCKELAELGLLAEELYGPANKDRLESEVMRRGVSVRTLLQNEGRLLAGSEEDVWRTATSRCDAVLAVGRSRKVDAMVSAARSAGKPVAHYMATTVFDVVPRTERRMKRLLVVADDGVTPEQAAKAYDMVAGYYGLFDVIFHDLAEPLVRHVPDLSIQLKIKTVPSAVSEPVPEVAYSSVVVPLRNPRIPPGQATPLAVQDVPLIVSMDFISGAATGASKQLEHVGEAAWLEMLTVAPYSLVVGIGVSEKVRFCGARAAGAHVPVIMLPKMEASHGTA